MQHLTLFSIICSALPVNLGNNVLKKYLPPDAHDLNNVSICLECLRNCEYLDWEAYMANNPDLAESSIDPIEHFITHGVFEGRRLYKKIDNIYNKPEDDIPTPSVSIIVINRNNAIYLIKCIESVLTQTYKDIEVILIDINSIDDSRQIMTEYAKKDKRIRLIFINKNCSMHNARKIGVSRSIGNNIMFLDPRDFLLPIACEKVLEVTDKGFEIVAFDINIVQQKSNISPIRKKWLNEINKKCNNQFYGPNVLRSIYINKNISYALFNKIYNGTICRQAFAQMIKCKTDQGAELYESFILCSQADNLCKIDEPLYNYSERDVDLCSNEKSYYLKQLYAYMTTNGLSEYYSFILSEFLNEELENFIDNTDHDAITTKFDDLAERFGIDTLIKGFVNRYFKKWQTVASQFKFYSKPKIRPKTIRKIGILYHILGHGGAENVIRQLAEILLAQGYEVTLYLAQAHDDDINLSKELQIRYYGAYIYDKPQVCSNLLNLHNYLQEDGVDVMLFHAASWDEALLWQLMLLKYMDISTLLFLHSSFYRRLIHPESLYTIHHFNSVLTCADKVVCLSSYGELYFRNIGIDAQYIHNPIPLPASDSPNFDKREDMIIICGRFSDPIKNISDSLYILFRVIKKYPHLKAIFIGNFGNSKARGDFFNLIDLLEIRENIVLTGWTEDSDKFFNKARIFLSSSYDEAFPLAIAEAQSHGVPVVMYEIPIMQARNNPAIIQVPQRDMDGGAEEIISLLGDPVRWNSLSQYARESCLGYSSANYQHNLLKLLNTFSHISNLTYYSPDDYRIVMRSLAYYGCHNPPWK